MDKEDVVYIYIYIYNGILATKRNEFESVEVRLMNSEPVTQSEISQKEKNNDQY